jgi:putative DNA methylase
MKIKNLGEPSADSSSAGLIDVLHRMCAFREKGETQSMAQFLRRSGHANSHSLWLIAQAVSEILPEGDKEKQLMKGLLNQKDGLVEATRQGELF